jgi:G3E family GTPase
VSAAAKIPVFLLTGFLGSGKTTLLNAALREPAMANTAVVVNELGAVGLDNLIIAQAADDVVLLDAGCLCCANTGALHETLADLYGRRAGGRLPPFERVIIETSGAADPAPLLNVLLGHPFVTASYALEATVCVVDAQHFLASRAQYPELDKQAAVAERIVISKRDLADGGPVVSFLKELNPTAEFVEGPAAFLPYEGTRKSFGSIGTLGPIRRREHFSGIRAFAFRPPPPVSWAGWAAWTRLVKAEFGARLIRVKGLLRIDETGEIVFVQGVQGVFHSPQRFQAWPDEDRGNRLVCIARDLREEEIAATLPALNVAPGTQAVLSMKDVEELTQRERQAQQ